MVLIDTLQSKSLASFHKLSSTENDQVVDSDGSDDAVEGGKRRFAYDELEIGGRPAKCCV